MEIERIGSRLAAIRSKRERAEAQGNLEMGEKLAERWGTIARFIDRVRRAIPVQHFIPHR
jgi:hypothetical protein